MLILTGRKHPCGAHSPQKQKLGAVEKQICLKHRDHQSGDHREAVRQSPHGLRQRHHRVTHPMVKMPLK